jgi:hypothetical protein
MSELVWVHIRVAMDASTKESLFQLARDDRRSVAKYVQTLIEEKINDAGRDDRAADQPAARRPTI